MTDRPILFSGQMVRALLAGTKTQTRRVLKPQPPYDSFNHEYRIAGAKWADARIFPAMWKVSYAPGDRLWVRENIWAESKPDGDGITYEADRSWSIIQNTPAAAQAWMNVWSYGDLQGHNMPSQGRLVPSIHMPRWASRLTLTVTEVRVQRVQEISETDARAEGVGRMVMDEDGNFYLHESASTSTYRAGFAGLWERLNGPRGYGWDDNPWCVAITFRAVLKNIDECD